MFCSRLKVLCLLLSLTALFVLSYQPGYAEDVELPPCNGFQGIYVDGAKTGYRSWSLATTEIRKKPFYKVEMEETTTENGAEVTATYSGVFGKDLTLKSFEYKKMQGKKETSVKARAVIGNVTISTVLKGSKFPDQKVKVTKGDMWEFCAPIVFALRNLPSDGEAKFAILLTQGARLNSFALKGKEKKIKFQGAEVAITEWTDENSRILIQVDESGRMIAFASTTKKGMKTEYIAESEELAKSGGSYDQLQEKKRAEAKKNNEALEIQGTVEGDDDELFSKCLVPVDKDAEESKKGEYLKIDGLFSIRAYEEWECKKGTHGSRWVVKTSDPEDGRIDVFVSEFSKDEERVDPESEDAKDEASRAFQGVFFRLVFSMTFNGGTISFSRTNCRSVLKFPDGEYLFLCNASVGKGTDNYDVYALLGQTEDKNITAFIMVEEGETPEELFKMLGSFRVLYDED